MTANAQRLLQVLQCSKMFQNIQERAMRTAEHSECIWGASGSIAPMQPTQTRLRKARAHTWPLESHKTSRAPQGTPDPRPGKPGVQI